MKNKSIISLSLGSITFCLFLLSIVFYLKNDKLWIVFALTTLIMLTTTALYISYYKENFTTNEKQHF